MLMSMPYDADAATTDLLMEEVRRLVAAAIGSGEILWVGPVANRLAETYPGSGLSRGRIIDELVLAASRSGVAVEISSDG